jgi:tetratricopeptide (TPR) repeat protein/TolB-like protein
MNCPACGRGNPDGAAVCGGCRAPLHEGATRVLRPAPTGAGGADERLAPGARLGARYEIVSLLGEGGMGSVYRARDHELEREVALKVIRPDMASRPEILERFKREILLASRVTHRNVLRIHDLGEAGGLRFISMHYVEGENLNALLAREGPLSLDRALPIIRQIAAGLQAAHEAGVVHRDLKPQNVLLDRDGNACIADFGISRSIAAGATMTETGAVLGTVDYMSPEQARGETPDHRSDLYALGMMIYEILTGTLPFRADNPLSVMMRRVHQDAPGLRRVRPDLPPWIAAIAARALARDPAARYPSAADLLRDLDRRRAAFGWRRFAGPRLLRAAGVATLLAVVPLVLFLSRGLRGRPAGGRPALPKTSVAILPFRNGTGDSRYDWIGAGLGALVRPALLDASALRVAGEDRVSEVVTALKFSAAGDLNASDARRIGSLLGVESVVTGALLRAGDRFRVEATILHPGAEGGSGVPIRVEGEGESALFAMADELARRLRTELGVGAGRSPAPPPTRSIEAMRLYEEALSLSRSGDWSGAAKRLETALAQDAGFSLARASLAETYAQLGYDDRAGIEARKAAEGLASLSPSEAARVRAVRARLTNDLPAAAEAYRALSAYAPNDVSAFLDLSAVLEEQGDLAGSLEAMRRVVALDPKHAEARYALGRLLAKLGRPAEALGEFNAALSLQTEGGTEAGRATVENGIGNVQKDLGHDEDALRSFGEALAIRRRIGDRRGTGVTLANIAAVHLNQGRYEEATKEEKEAIAIAAEIGDRDGQAHGLSDLGDTYQAAGRPQDALQAYQSSLAILRETGDEASTARVLDDLGAVNSVLGRYVEAFFFLKDALEKSRGVGDKVEILRSLVDIGVVEQVQGRYDEALKYDLEALARAREIGNRWAEASLSANLAEIRTDQGDYAAALSLLGDAESAARRLSAQDILATVLADRARVRRLLGDASGAQKDLAEAAPIAEPINSTALEAQILIERAALAGTGGGPQSTGSLARAAVAAGEKSADRRLILLARATEAQLSRSTRLLQEVLGQTRSAGLSPFVAPMLLALARSRETRGDTRGSESALQDAIRSAGAIGQKDLLFQGHASLAGLLSRRGDRSGAMAHALEALGGLENLRKGLPPDLLRHLLERPDTLAFGRLGRALLQSGKREADAARLQAALRP